MINFIKKLCALGERQGQGVLAAQAVIEAELARIGVPYSLERFISATPKRSARLAADGEQIPCEATSFTGGAIDSKSAILSSMIPSRFNRENANINFNPYARSISCPNFYHAPAIAVAREDIGKIIAAEAVSGEVVIERMETRVSHILVGNAKNPKHVVFAHYDSISTGALDNASGVAVALAVIERNPGALADTLFVFDPAEELSFDQPTYWGYGFRVFEAAHPSIMDQAQTLIPIDCVGNGPVAVDADPGILRLAFPISRFDELQGKMSTLYSDIQGLARIYHSAEDTPEKLSEAYLAEAADKLGDLVSR